MNPRYLYLVIAVALIWPIFPASGADSAVGKLRRLYDFSPVSASNPVIARVAECEIEIPLSEFRGYLEAQPQPEDGHRKPLTLAEKRACLEQLLDDHFLLWEGFRQKGDQSGEMVEMMKTTESMLLRETLASQEVDDKAKTPEDHRRLTAELMDRVFEKETVTVSSDVYGELKDLVKRLKNEPSTLTAIRPETKSRSLANCDLGTVTVGDFLEAYVALSPDRRPNIEESAGLNEMLKVIMGDALLTKEARARGLEKSPVVLQYMQQNLNTLTRMYAIDRLTDRAVEQTRRPDYERQLKAWYEEHKATHYIDKDDKGIARSIPYESAHEMVEADYFESIQERTRIEAMAGIRKGKKIEINDKLLETTAF